MKKSLAKPRGKQAPDNKKSASGYAAVTSRFILEELIKQTRLLTQVARVIPFAVLSLRQILPLLGLTPPGSKVSGARTRPFQVRKESGVWKVVFMGKVAVILDDKGMPLIAYLLKHPPVNPIHAVELEMRVWVTNKPDSVVNEVVTEAARDGQPVDLASMLRQANGARLNDGQNTLLKRRVRELLQVKADLTLPEIEREAAEAELDKIHAALFGKGGRASDEASRAVDRVRHAIKRLVRKLEKPSRDTHATNEVLLAFAAHLRKHLLIPSRRYSQGKGSRNRAGVAGTFTYEPPPGVVWHG